MDKPGTNGSPSLFPQSSHHNFSKMADHIHCMNQIVKIENQEYQED